MLRKFEDLHKGETCVVIGNGPSLKDAPLELIEKYLTFGSNKIFLLPYTPDFYCIIDRDMLHDCTEVLTSGDFQPAEVFIPRGYPIPGSNQIKLAIEASFSANINEKIVMGGTVTYALLQIAYYMGFERALLIGCDHDYPGAAVGGLPGSKFLAKGEDVDHFHPDYFKEGRVYNRPELEGTSEAYALALKVWKEDGREIINLTPGTKLETIPKGRYEDWIS